MRKFVVCGLASMLAGVCVGAVPQSAFATSACEEGFDQVDTLAARGWTLQNNSDPTGWGVWSQGDPNVFQAATGAPDSYASVGADSAMGQYPVVSNWLITPEIVFGPNEYNVRIFSFYTRALAGAANRLVVRLCVESDSVSCAAPGPESGDVGNFQTVLLNINPDLLASGYPLSWTQYALAPADGLPVMGRGRIAFHYYVFAQPNGAHGTTIGIDAVSMMGATACPFTDVMLAAGFE